jgi:hypothetical protein
MILCFKLLVSQPKRLRHNFRWYLINCMIRMKQELATEKINKLDAHSVAPS